MFEMYYFVTIKIRSEQTDLDGSEGLCDKVAVIRGFGDIIIALDGLPAERPVGQVLVDHFPRVVQDRGFESF